MISAGENTIFNLENAKVLRNSASYGVNGLEENECKMFGKDAKMLQKTLSDSLLSESEINEWKSAGAKDEFIKTVIGENGKLLVNQRIDWISKNIQKKCTLWSDDCLKPKDKFKVITELGNFRKDAENVADVLAQNINQQNSVSKNASISALAKIGYKPETMVYKLLNTFKTLDSSGQLLNLENDKTRKELLFTLVWAFGKFGGKASHSQKNDIVRILTALALDAKTSFLSNNYPDFRTLGTAIINALEDMGAENVISYLIYSPNCRLNLRTPNMACKNFIKNLFNRYSENGIKELMKIKITNKHELKNAQGLYKILGLKTKDLKIERNESGKNAEPAIDSVYTKNGRIDYGEYYSGNSRK